MQDDVISVSSSNKSKVNLSKGKMWETLFNQKVLQERRCKLTWWKYLFIVLYQQLAFNEILYLTESLFKWGSILVIVAYYLLSIFIGMPFFMITIFMGSYTKKSYLKVWKIRPLVQGFGYTIMISIYLQECVNLGTAGLALIYIREIFSEECYPINIGRKKIEENNGSLINKNLTKIDGFGSGLDWSIIKNINSTWVVHMIVLWIIIYLATIMGYEKCSTIITKFTKYSMILVYIPIFVTIAWGGQTNTVPEYLKSKWLDLYNFEFWEDILDKILSCVIPGNLLLLSTYMSFNIDVCDNTYIVQGTKLALISIILTGMTILVSKLQTMYDIKFTKLKGFDVFFVLLPVLLDEAGSTVLTILWFFIVLIWTTVPSIFTVLGIIDTMIENFPMLMKYRVCFCTFANSLAFMINACVLTDNFLPNLHIWNSMGWPVLCAAMFFVYSIIIFIHSSKKISMAYTAVYIKSWGKFWKNFLNLAQIIVICLVIYKIYKHYKTITQGYTKMVTILILLIVLICILPMLLGVIWIYGKSKNSKEPNLTTIRKLSSLKQKPKSILSGRQELIRCEHNCLLNSKKLEDLIDQAYLKNKYISNYVEINKRR